MFYGLNNSGKSNLLKFINLIFTGKGYLETTKYEDEGITKERKALKQYSNDFWEGDISNKPFIFFRDEWNNSKIEFEISIWVEQQEIPYIDILKKHKFVANTANDFLLTIKGEVIGKSKDISEIKLIDVSIKKRHLFALVKGEKYYFENLAIPELNKQTFEHIMRIFNDSTLFLDSDRYFTKELENVDNNLFSTKNFKNWLFNLYLSDFEKFKLFKEFINSFEVKCIDDPTLENNLKNHPLNNGDIGFTRLGKELEIMFSNLANNRLPLSNFGDGVQQLLSILSTLFNSNSKIVLIEEIELNLHPKFQLLLLDFLSSMIDLMHKTKQINQVFFTTHSPFFIHRSDLTKMYEVQIDQNGHSQYVKNKKSRVRQYFSDRKNYLIINTSKKMSI